MSSAPERLVPRRGNYKELISYRKANTIFRITYYFCQKYLSPRDRTVDQMVQAARSGKQNIIEGSAASSTSSKTEIKLLNVAKASLLELLEDYEDYLATRNHLQWQPDSKEFAAMRRLGREHNDAEYYMNLIETRPPETIANMAIILIKQTDYLLHKQIQAIADTFVGEGGFSERMYRLRQLSRTK
ncbi:MAG: four helix bundle protein [Bacteroides sp.]|nr:four helix bundle protein [Bacteroides sp.]MDE6222497.1 four helix bundle suffix domain-containing protein [Muribaculaceae bacterium]